MPIDPDSSITELDVEDAATFVGAAVAPAVGRYQFIAELGQGGMATVYLAVHRGPMGVRKLSVVKLMRADATEDPDFVDMFIEEARLACKLSHPNVVHTYEVGDDGGKHYIAMEYLEGVSLQQWINRLGYRKQFTFADHIRVLIDVLKGLQYAHDAKDFDGTPLELVHRDISPHNILVTYDGQVKVVDFGIAKAADSRVETRVGTIKGKVTYMSPEQALMGVVDNRADVYAVGVMLWEAASQRRRWKGVAPALVLTKLRGPDACIPPVMDAGALRDRVQQITDRALNARLSERYTKASEMSQDLESLLRFIGDDAPASEVGRRLAEVFDEERVTRQLSIQKQIRALDVAEKNGGRFEVAPAIIPMAAASSTAFNTSAGESKIGQDREPTGDGTQVSGAVTESKVHELPPAARRNLLKPIGMGALALVALGGVWTATRPGPQATVPTVAPASGVVAPVSPTPGAAVVPSRPAEHSLTVETDPQEARITVNGAPLDPRDHFARLPAGTWVMVRAVAPGFLPEERQLKLDTDMQILLQLHADPAGVGGKHPAASAAGKPPVKLPAPGPSTTPTVAPQVPATPAQPAVEPGAGKPGRPVRPIDGENPLAK